MIESNHDKRTEDVREKFELLLMAAVDGELTNEQKVEFNALIQENPEFRAEFEQYKRLKEVTTSMRMKSPPEEVWDTYWYRVYNRIERKLGWIFVSIGAVILLTYSLYHLVLSIFASQEIEGFIKIAIISLLAGFIILLISVLREKLFVHRTDPYKEIKR